MVRNRYLPKGFFRTGELDLLRYETFIKPRTINRVFTGCRGRRHESLSSDPRTSLMGQVSDEELIRTHTFPMVCPGKDSTH